MGLSPVTTAANPFFSIFSDPIQRFPHKIRQMCTSGLYAEIVIDCPYTGIELKYAYLCNCYVFSTNAFYHMCVVIVYVKHFDVFTFSISCFRCFSVSFSLFRPRFGFAILIWYIGGVSSPFKRLLLSASRSAGRASR